MIVLGVILIVVSLLVESLKILFTIGIIVLIVGVVLALLGRSGRAVGGRNHWY
jgi:membrane-bound ClpP family serine protease